MWITGMDERQHYWLWHTGPFQEADRFENKEVKQSSNETVEYKCYATNLNSFSLNLETQYDGLGCTDEKILGNKSNAWIQSVYMILLRTKSLQTTVSNTTTN